MAADPWHEDPSLRGSFHPEDPDDLQVVVHDGEPRRTGLNPEVCWVRITGIEGRPPRPCSFATERGLSPEEFTARYAGGPVYLGTLLNQPNKLQTVAKGDLVRFVAGNGLKQPLVVSGDYVRERQGWEVLPCSQCAAAECLDPPSVMMREQLAKAPPNAVLNMFTRRCVFCGEGAVVMSRPQPAPPEPPPPRPWWRLW